MRRFKFLVYAALAVPLAVMLREDHWVVPFLRQRWRTVKRGPK